MKLLKKIGMIRPMPKVIVDVQYACDLPNLPNKKILSHWVKTALQNSQKTVELTIRIVGEKEGIALNEQWRHGVGATNVLSFPFECPTGITLPLLGDIVICAPVVVKEAEAQNIDLEAHWAHLVVHGVLHLLGYDHETDEEAEKMENLEKYLLNEQLRFSLPCLTKFES
jgi:probable rRNA maturation factor